MLIAGAHRQIRCQSVQIDCGFHGARRLARKLRQHAGDQSGQQVAAAALRHPRIARGIHGDATVRVRNDGPCALQHHSEPMAHRKRKRGLKPMRLHLSHRRSREPRHFTGVRCQHHGSAFG